jgi:putative NADH-flavin reductase
MGPVGDDPGTVYSDAIAAVASAMSAAGIRRLAVTANARVLDDRPLTGPFAAVSEEHRRALGTLRQPSDLEWTVVATPLLSDDVATGTYAAVLDGLPEGEKISRPDFACALVDALDHEAWVGHVVGVAGP